MEFRFLEELRKYRDIVGAYITRNCLCNYILNNIKIDFILQKWIIYVKVLREKLQFGFTRVETRLEYLLPGVTFRVPFTQNSIYCTKLTFQWTSCKQKYDFLWLLILSNTSSHFVLSCSPLQFTEKTFLSLSPFESKKHLSYFALTYLTIHHNILNTIVESIFLQSTRKQ